jgi:hypothetical protein
VPKKKKTDLAAIHKACKKYGRLFAETQKKASPSSLHRMKLWDAECKLLALVQEHDW